MYIYAHLKKYPICSTRGVTPDKFELKYFARVAREQKVHKLEAILYLKLNLFFMVVFLLQTSVRVYVCVSLTEDYEEKLSHDNKPYCVLAHKTNL